MTQEQLEKELTDISDSDLLERCDTELSKLCETGGGSFRMCVPVHPGDTDVLFAELLKRFGKKIKDQSS